MPRWTTGELATLKSLTRRHAAIEAIAMRLGKSQAAVRKKARREGLRVISTVALPKLDRAGRLVELGGVANPERGKR